MRMCIARYQGVPVYLDTQEMNDLHIVGEYNRYLSKLLRETQNKRRKVKLHITDLNWLEKMLANES